MMRCKFLFHFCIIIASSFWGLSYAQKEQHYDYVEAFNPFFILKSVPERALQVDSLDLHIGRIQQITCSMQV